MNKFRSKKNNTPDSPHKLQWFGRHSPQLAKILLIDPDDRAIKLIRELKLVDDLYRPFEEFISALNLKGSKLSKLIWLFNQTSLDLSKKGILRIPASLVYLEKLENLDLDEIQYKHFKSDKFKNLKKVSVKPLNRPYEKEKHCKV